MLETERGLEPLVERICNPKPRLGPGRRWQGPRDSNPRERDLESLRLDRRRPLYPVLMISAAPQTLTISFTCGCWGNENCDKPTAAAASTIYVISAGGNGSSLGDGYYLDEVRPPKPSRRDRGFLEGLSRMKLRQDRRRFKRF